MNLKEQDNISNLVVGGHDKNVGFVAAVDRRNVRDPVRVLSSGQYAFSSSILWKGKEML